MKIIIFLILTQQFLSCEKNCFLGGIFFSSPLDEQGCCVYQENDHCERYIQINQGQYMCDRCEIGYKWFNNKCLRMKSNKKCLNPEMSTFPFYPCQVCKFSDDQKYIPVFNNENPIKKYSCKKIDKTNVNIQVLNRLKNCIASGADKDTIFCYKCQDGYIENWKNQECVPVEKDSKYKGCQVTMDQDTCDICNNNYQFNIKNRLCIERNVNIDYSQGNKIGEALPSFYRVQDNKIDLRKIVMNNQAFQDQMNNLNKIQDTFQNLKNYVQKK